MYMTARILKLKLENIKWETPDTATFYLSNTEVNEPVNYKAGQFITLIFNHRNEEIRRSYSLSSSPDEPLLAITIKRISNGEISRFMLTKIQPGNVLTALAPAGRFIIANYQESKDILFFAGGSGFTPIFSQIKYILNRAGDSRLTLVYSNQDAASILFKAELDRLAALHPDRFTIHYLLSSEANRLNPDGVEALTRKTINNLSTAEFYLCGPFPYMRMIRFALVYMGIEPGQIRRENFVLETVAVTNSAINFPPRNIRINYGGEIHDLVVGENQSILQAALQNNVPLPYSCRNGVCSTCVAKCTGGKVEMVKNDVLTEADIAEGWVLTCTGHPVDNEVQISF